MTGNNVRVRLSGCWQAVTGADHSAVHREILRQYIKLLPAPLTPADMGAALDAARIMERVRTGDARDFDVGPDVDGVPLAEFARQ